MQEKPSSKALFTERTQAAPSNRQNHVRRSIVYGLVLVVVVTLLAIYTVHWAVQSRTEGLNSSMDNRLQLLAGGRADVFSTWLSGLAKQGNRVIQSDLFRLYAAEVDLIETDIATLLTATLDPPPEGLSPEVVSLAAQLPMMQNLLKEFTRYSGFLDGRIVNRSGQSYIATDANTLPLNETDFEHTRRVLAENKPRYSRLVHTANGLRLNLYLPILPPQADDNAHSPVAVLILSKGVSAKINELLAPSLLAGEGERTRLVQKSNQGFDEIVPWLPGETSQVLTHFNAENDGDLPFAMRQSLEGGYDVYSVGAKVKGIDWWVVHEVTTYQALAPLRTFTRVAIGMVALGALALLLLLGALWWRLIGTQNQKMADEFRTLAEQIEKQRQFLGSINGNLTEYIGLKDNAGVYQYVNPAFAEAMGRTPEEMIGLDDVALFGYDTAKRLEGSDHWVIEHREPTTINEQIYLQSQLHHLQISKVPFIDPGGKLSGIVSVYRDITEIVEVQRRSERAVRQTIEALVKTIEETDPYLAGHSRLMSGLGAQVAKRMSISEQEVSTVETAAYLSQIGKVFIPKELLNKAGALTDSEKKTMEKHVDHAANILQDIEFELPIFDSIYQMNEMMDGSGYPKGLKAEDICQTARILAATNSFCAMVKTRSYRPARPVDEALTILQKATDSYDQEVIKALVDVVQSHDGEKLLAENT